MNRSFESWSSLNNSLVVDISHMNSFEISDDRREATVGAGIRLGALYVRLNQYGVTFHGGICPTVGLGGYSKSILQLVEWLKSRIR